VKRPIVVLAAAALLATACAPAEAPDARPPATLTATPTPTPTPTPPPPLPWGPTEDQYAGAAQIVAGMSVEEQAGQVIVAQYQTVGEAAQLVGDLHIGGVIVMGQNVVSPDQVRSDIATLQRSAARPYPLLVGVDQEGGKVARLGAPVTEFPSLMTLGAARDAALARRVARASGDELRALGFTMVFAPDADVTSGPDDPTMGSRSASSDPEVVSEVVTAELAGYADAGIVAVVKHFPGHGSVPADSHEELPVQGATLDELRARDFAPFLTAVDDGAPAVMVGHIDVTAVDPGVPSSLSAPVVGLLRDEHGFDGLVVTDAQNMAAVAGTYGSGDAAVRSLAAGADIVLMPVDVRAAHAAIVAAVADGRLSATRLSDAATRGVALMLHTAAGGVRPAPSVVGSHADVSYAASLAGLTIVSGACRGPLVGGAIQVRGGTEADRARLVAAAEAAGLTVGSGDLVRLLGGNDPGRGAVVVALDTPYGLGDSSATSARIALYGRTPQAFRALVAVLLGKATGGGMLPVAVHGVEQPGCAHSVAG